MKIPYVGQLFWFLDVRNYSGFSNYMSGASSGPSSTWGKSEGEGNESKASKFGSVASKSSYAASVYTADEDGPDMLDAQEEQFMALLKGKNGTEEAAAVPSSNQVVPEG
jgi:hypothetical protein